MIGSTGKERIQDWLGLLENVIRDLSQPLVSLEELGPSIDTLKLISEDITDYGKDIATVNPKVRREA